VNHDTDLGGLRLRRGTEVMFSPWVVQRSPSLWEEPLAFRPERFASERVAQMPRYAYFPFVGGPRQCIGNSFALMEGQLVLATILQRWRLVPVPGHVVEPEPLLTLRPRHGVRMTLAPV
jgi:cytochrome P450